MCSGEFNGGAYIYIIEMIGDAMCSWELIGGAYIYIIEMD